MLAKGRLLGIQFEELFKNNKYFEISKNAMECAELLYDGLKKKDISSLIHSQQINYSQF